MNFHLFGLPLARRATIARADPAADERALLDAAALPVDALLAAHSTTVEGLSNHEAAERYRDIGPNTIAEDRPAGPGRLLLQAFMSPLSLLLLVLAAISIATGERRGAETIAAMVLLSSLLSFVQEYRSGKAAESLRAMVHVKATIRRRLRGENGTLLPSREVHVPLVHIVPGDVVVLSVGNLVPADARILSAKDLYLNEAALTGESLPVEKRPGVVEGGRSPVELGNVALMGSYVTSGNGIALVLATGQRTYLGGVAHAARGRRGPTSFDAGVRRYVWLILRFMLVMVPAVFLINGVTKGDWGEAFLFALAVAVGLTPEMLPMVVTINLAKGALAMARKRTIVKHLPAIQDIGAMDVLATDKTGTLTQDRVLLERHLDIFGAESLRVLEFACLNSFFQTGERNLLDQAVLEHADLHEHLKAGGGYTKVDEIPFDFERRRSSVIVAPDGGGRHLLICKGAVEEVFTVCERAERDGVPIPLGPAHGEALHQVTRELNEDGFRVIAVAWKELPEGPPVYTVADESGLVLLGYIAFLDPPKETASAAIAALVAGGISVKVLTGDNDAVARHVCRQVGLRTEGVLTGAQVDALADADLADAAERTTLFAKMSPEQKAKVIRALRARDHVVGYLGDGINDGPALKAADVGISVDTAADVAKGTADIILLEKSLLVLNDGVVEGRKVFGNVIKYVRLTGSSNFGNMLSMVGASALLPFLPMTPVQILFNNLLYDVSQTAVATDRVDPEFLARPRRWDIGGIGRYMLGIGPLSSLFDYATFGVMVWAFNGLALPALFQTGWFVESLLSQTLIVHVIRTGRIPFIESRPSNLLLATTIGISLLGVWLPFSPLAPVLGLVALPTAYFAALAVILLCYLTLTQLVKTWILRRFKLA